MHEWYCWKCVACDIACGPTDGRPPDSVPVGDEAGQDKSISWRGSEVGSVGHSRIERLDVVSNANVEDMALKHHE